MLVKEKVPSLGVNDKKAKITWIVEDHQHVTKGDLIGVLETTKTAFDMEASCSGYISALCDVGTAVEEGQIIFMIADSVELLESEKLIFLENLKGAEDVVKATYKAQSLAKHHGINLTDLRPLVSGIIREKDVEFFLKKIKKPNPVLDAPPRGALNTEFIRFITSDRESFAMLSSSEKIEKYRKNGAVIEDDVIIGHGSVIIAKFINLESSSSIGSNCYIRAEEFSLGKMSTIGNNANFVTRKIKIGDVCTFGPNVMLSGGFSKRSEFSIGNSSLVSGYCLLDAGEGITIGVEVGISPFVKLYTHNHWQSELDGYHSNFGPITINDKAYITGDCLLVPGVTIGEGATVLANSTVVTDVEPYTQMCGNPARVVGRVQTDLSLDKKERIVLNLLKEMKAEFEASGAFEKDNVAYIRQCTANDLVEGKIIITFDISGDLEIPQYLCVFDLKNLLIHGKEDLFTDEVRNFLRRRGIRFKPIYWRYTAERYLYND